METPSSSTRRVTRSLNLNASNNGTINSRKIEDSEKNNSKSKGQQQDRSALIDITNDSPIIGVANGGNIETPLAKQRGSRVKNTPGSGEALLRDQVKTLLQLQKVEEEIFAPTPAIIPQIQNLSSGGTTGLASVIPLNSQVLNHMFDGKNQENSESEESLITRSLLLDFSEKSRASDASEECSSELSYQEVVQGSEVSSCYIEKLSANTEDDDASVWSMQVNASTHDEYDDEEDEEIAEDEQDYYEDVEEEHDDGGLVLDELCKGLNNISMSQRIAPKFAGKHKRFVYNSDDELVNEEEENYAESVSASSPNILRLKGLPTPKGKHIRFSEEKEEKSDL
ncbi:uncharacterized protein LOC133291364 [Gastrolobium bilobum]|uniref:uncharacterized protein LOC133291364 n=1 Tax=Gastrolobium bilobum TaxID=150636 RepID=UPI002AB00E00|nr:uncharacterized protein LOC133291364 [Gastrolobium bilobum]